MGRRQALLSVFCTILLLAGARVEAADSYYKGKRITLLINFAAGGPTDIEGRLFVPSMQDYLKSRVTGPNALRSRMASTVSVVEPGVIAPLFGYNLA